MSSIKATLDCLDQVLLLAEEYFAVPGHEASDWETLSRYIRSRMPTLDGLEVLEMLQFFRKHAPLALGAQVTAGPKDEIQFENLDLMEELKWQYGIARTLLHRLQNSPEIKDIKDALGAAQRLLSDVVKLRERILNTDHIQEFMTAVLQILNECDPKLAEAAIKRFEELGGGVDRGLTVLADTDTGIDLREGAASVAQAPVQAAGERT